MTIAVTLVHAPGSVTEATWKMLLRHAPGDSPHECRLIVESAGTQEVSGARMESAVRELVAEVSESESLNFALSTGGSELASVELGSPLIHPGMVILLSPPDLPLASVRRTPLSLCVASGPDSGQLIPLSRNTYVIGRGRVDVPIADPQLSRLEAVLDVGSHHIRLIRQERVISTEVTTADTFALGASTCRLVLGAPGRSGPQRWPVPEAPVAGKPPQGRHSMMLVFALVPLVAGLVLALVTGLWFFLLFSAASAIIASSIFIHGQRQRARYRSARRAAARSWAKLTAETLASPGDAAHLLRSDEDVHISAADEDPVVRLGMGEVEAQLEADPGAKEMPAETVTTAVGINLAPGQTTVLSGAPRECLRLQRWMLLQLMLNPVRGDIALVSHGSDLRIPELRDVPRCRLVRSGELSTLPSPVNSCGVLLAAETLDPAAAEHALRAGWHIVACSGDAPLLLSSPGWNVSLSEHAVQLRAGTIEPQPYAAGLRVDGLSAPTLRQLCRLALRHTAAAVGPAQLPAQASLRLPDELFTGSAAEELLAELGPSLSGPEQLDLVGEGPHVLIAGTTGSGKSELLKTMLLSLCARYSPLELSMVLVDFKGGATFQRMDTLEHVLGVVTDLSQAAAERTLESIRSELVRRERLFLAAGAGDYVEYRSLSAQALPRMLVVIDEFRIFAHELPAQLDELMRLATLGRSLGLHLVLSTQRPQGAVTADIRANIGAAVALRMRGEDESRDVLGTAEAATIPRTLPGRALLRRPGEQPVELQTALLAAEEPTVRLRPEIHAATTAEPPQTGDVVATIDRRLRQCRLHRPHTPLLPPLPETLRPQQALGEDQGALLGRVDDPSGQVQYDLRLNPQQAASFALIGEASAGGGPSCAAVASQLLRTSRAALYLLDGDRSLLQLDSHPQVGAWLTDEHMRETLYLLDRLCEELTARRVGRGESQQPLVIVLTGYTHWLAHSQTGTGLEHQLGMLAAEGPQVGISVLMAGGRELAVGKLAGRFPTRIYLPFGSGEDVTYLWPKLRSTEALPGRGVLVSATVTSPGKSVQLVTDGDHDSCDPVAAAASTTDAPAIDVRPLPERLEVSQLPRDQVSGVVVGIQQLGRAPAVLQLGSVNLILGSPRTGKTTCLQLLQHQVPGAVLVKPGDGPATAEAEVLLIDDAHRCTPEEHHSVEAAIRSGTPVVATAPASSAVFHQVPWAQAARTQGNNVILSPTSRAEAEAFAALIPTLERPIPGRAVHLRPEGAVIAQWALPPTR